MFFKKKYTDTNDFCDRNLIRAKAYYQLMELYQNTDFNQGINYYDQRMFSIATDHFKRLINAGVNHTILHWFLELANVHKNQDIIHVDSLLYFEKFLTENKNFISECIIQWGVFEGRDCFLHVIGLLKYDIDHYYNGMKKHEYKGVLKNAYEKRIGDLLRCWTVALLSHFDSIEKIAEIALEKRYDRALRQIIFCIEEVKNLSKFYILDNLDKEIYQKCQQLYNVFDMRGVRYKQIIKDYAMLNAELNEKKQNFMNKKNKGEECFGLLLDIQTLERKLYISASTFERTEFIREVL